MLIKKRKNTVPPWKIFILTVVGFGLMLAIAVHSRNEALNRLSQEYTITDDAKPRHIKFESMPVGEAEQAVGMYLRYNAMVQFEESGKILSVNGAGAVRRRLFDMGVTPGADVLLRKKAPLGDPLEITIRGYELSLRKTEAACVEMLFEARRAK